MLRSLKEIVGYRLDSRDEENPGKVRDFLLDDRDWKLRYLVSDVGGWLLGRRVLVPAGALDEADRDDRAVNVSLDEEQIASQPPLSADEPLSRQHKVEVHLKDQEGPLSLKKIKTSGDPHLRSFKELKGYRIESRDGEAGRVTDLIFDDDTNRVCCLVVNTRGRLPGKEVLVISQSVDRIDSGRKRIVVDRHRREIAERMPYNPAAPVNRMERGESYDYLGRRQ